MTNFDFLRSEKRFASFAGAASAAEMIFPIDTAACVVNVRRAAELTVKWMFATDRSLILPKRDSLSALTATPEFRAAVGAEMTKKLNFIRRVGNNAAHNPESVTKEQAALSLRHLFDFANFIAKRYNAPTAPYPYDPALLSTEEEIVTEALDSRQIAELIRENRRLKRALRSYTAAEDASYQKKDDTAPLSEADTRRLYVETDLTYAGWRIGVDCFSEYPIENLAAGSGVGYADYVLFHEEMPLAVVETQPAGDDPAIGRQQAKVYADALEKQFGHRPVIFLTSGTDTRIWQDTAETERRVAGIFSKADLLRLKSIRDRKESPRALPPDGAVIDRPYQMEAAAAAMDAICQKGKRRICLSMAPATGKTRTALAIAAQLYQLGWVRNILYLTEQPLLARQAKAACADFPELRCTSLSGGDDPALADVLIATYDTLLSDADDLYDPIGAHLFTPGHFDLILCDEADAAQMEKYRDITDAFDARLILLTSAPPLDEEETVFTYSYTQAAEDGWISPLSAWEMRLAALENGISPANLSEAERKTYRNLFRDRGMRSPQTIPSSALFCQYYNEDTVRLMLKTLYEKGAQRNGTLGKTIIFTNNPAHSEMIYTLWYQLYPDTPPHFCRTADSTTNYAESLISDFSATEKYPRVLLSHDLLRDGVDIPAVENIVFFTRANCRTEFWRMLGRGMRLYPKKAHCFVLDLYGNFRTFSENPQVSASPLPAAGRLFCLYVRLVKSLQTLEHAVPCASLRTSFIEEILRAIRLVDRDSFSARRRAGILDRFSDRNTYTALSQEDAVLLCREIAPLMLLSPASSQIASLDERMLSLILARTSGKNTKDTSELLLSLKTDAEHLAKQGTHHKITRQKKLLNRIIHNDYLENASLPELDEARLALRPLMQYLPTEKPIIRTQFTDTLLSLSHLDTIRI